MNYEKHTKGEAALTEQQDVIIPIVSMALGAWVNSLRASRIRVTTSNAKIDAKGLAALKVDEKLPDDALKP